MNAKRESRDDLKWHYKMKFFIVSCFHSEISFILPIDLGKFYESMMCFNLIYPNTSIASVSLV